MRDLRKWNDNWQFILEDIKLEDYQNLSLKDVCIPHTWNNLDGQDGGNDYYRGAGWYFKKFNLSDINTSLNDIYVEFEGVNSICDVYVNNEFVVNHKGGFSTFRIKLNDYLIDGENVIAVRVDNSENDYVYPQYADFTFFGGIYRNINLITVNKTHFALDYFGGNGLKVTPKVVSKEESYIDVETYIVNQEEGDILRVELITKEGRSIASYQTTNIDKVIRVNIRNARLWNGIKDPYLYTIDVQIISKDGVIKDNVTQKVGIRSFYVDKELGFFLNGESYPLRGVCRHQDRKDKGWAISYLEHLEDIKLIQEVGANTIRLAHYQHSQDFYNLCDEYGFIIWAEIPFISCYMKNGKENTFSQMKELIIQNYNHPSIVTWGLSNEITMRGESDSCYNDHVELNKFVKSIDDTRFTTIAHVSMLPIDSKMVKVADVCSYNIYYGWYSGTFKENGPWLDKFHETNPDIALGISEYGCEAVLKWHSTEPRPGDYTEEYQALYHEELIRTINARPYLWATHVWNMFDFAADARDEGGVKGMNNKGLVTYDRKTKKDSFYLYKAYWSNDEFVHITSKRFNERYENTINVKVYSNLENVELTCNGELCRLISKDEKIFIFEVNLTKEFNYIKCTSGNATDECVIKKVSEKPTKFTLDDTQSIKNWFEGEDKENFRLDIKEGYYNINDPLSVISKNEEAKAIILEFLKKAITKAGMISADTLGSGMFDQFNMSALKMVKISGTKDIRPELIMEYNEKLLQISK